VATDAVGRASERAVTLSVSNVNEAPTVTSGATASVAENGVAGATVATLSATDPDGEGSGFAAPFSYALVTGTGDTDNGKFSIDGDLLKLTNPADFESQGSYRRGADGGVAHRRACE